MLALALPLTAREAAAPGPGASAATSAKASIEFSVDAASPGPAMNLEFIGNASRLDTLLALRSGADLRSPATVPGEAFFRERYPHFKRFRIGNIFFGYECAGLDFDEMAVRRSDGRIEYRFEQTLAMLQRMLDAGIRPHLALSGTPLALVPPGETPIRHRTYGCVNAPRIDWARAAPRERVPEWWALQDAFVAALVARFGPAEVGQWTFATWTEPMNPARRTAHLVLPEAVVSDGRHDAAVAAIVAASIDVAMRHGLHIRLGNLAGRVEKDYPALVREIGKFPRGREYLAYVEGYAISRYRTQPGQDIGRALDAALGLLADPAMPAKPLFVDEFGDLAGHDGAEPFAPAAGLEGARFLATALQRLYERQDGSVRSPAGMAFWRDQIGPRARDSLVRRDAYLQTPLSHVTAMFASLQGLAKLPVAGPARQAIAGGDAQQLRIILLPAVDARADGRTAARTRVVAFNGLRADSEYELRTTEVDRLHGNPISAFIGGAADYAQDRTGRFAPSAGKWQLATPLSQACFFDENPACAWRDKAREIEQPRVRTVRARADAAGTLRFTLLADAAAFVMVEASPSRFQEEGRCPRAPD